MHNTSASAGRGPEQWINSFNLDLMPLVHLVDAAQPALAASGSGAVVAIGTTNALETAPPAGANSYGALKAAVIQYASALGHTLAPQGIRVNTVSPGPGVVPRRRVGDDQGARCRELYESVLANIPIGSMASDDDIANAITFLASPAAGHITGDQPRRRRRLREARAVLMKPGGRIDAVLVCGGKYHDFDFARRELLAELGAFDRVKTRVVEDYACAEKDGALAGADLLVTYTCDVRPTPCRSAASTASWPVADAGSHCTAPTPRSIRLHSSAPASRSAHHARSR